MWGGGSPSRSLRCPTPKPSPRASTITVSLPGKRNLPSLVRWLPEVLTTFALHLREQGVFSPQGAVGASGQERREEEAHLTCRRGRGARRVPVLVPTPGLGGREPRTESPPLVPARAPRRSPRSGAWSAGLRVGGALTSLGCQHSGISSGRSSRSDALRSPCGPEPGRSFVFRGTQPQTRTPREGRGGVGAGAARAVGRRAGWGCLGLEAKQQVALPGLCALRPRATPPLGLPLPQQRPPTPTHLPTRRGRILPLCLAVVPLQILGRALAAKGSEMHKDAAKEGNSGRSWGSDAQPWGSSLSNLHLASDCSSQFHS